MKMSRSLLDGVLSGVLSVQVLCLAASAHAQSPTLKPGLWEMQVQGGGVAGMPDMAEMHKAMQQMQAQMQAQMARMPPEQRKMMEAQMGKMGVAVTATGIRTCMTEEDIRHEDIPMSDENCDTTIKTRTASRWVATTVCREPAMTGEAEALFESPVAYTVKVKGVISEGGRKRPYDMNMRFKHVGTDCGTVKPVSALRAEQLQQQRKAAR